MLVRPRRDEIELAEQRQRAAQQAEQKRLEAEEARFESELDAFEQESENQVALPPETPQEKRELELVRRIEALEGKQLQPDAVPLHRDRTRERKEYALKDGLRMRRAERRGHEEAARNDAHAKACAREVDDLECKISELDSERAAEDGRHSEVVRKISASRRELDELRASILLPLNDNETSQGRLQAVLGERTTS